MQDYMRRRNIKTFSHWTDRHISIYTQARIHHLVKKNPNPKPYLFDNLRKLLYNNFRYTAPLQFMRYKSIITKTINIFTKNIYSKSPSHTKSANIFEWKTIKEAAMLMIASTWKSYMSALVLLLTHVVGCRAAEALELRWEDFKKESNENGKFWIWTIRVSKNNPMAMKHEQLTYKRHPSKRLFEEIYIKYREILGKPKSGRMFPLPWARTCNVNYQLTKISRIMNLKGKISCHSGRNYATNKMITSNATPQTIRCTLRWAPNSTMIDRYRSIQLETSKIGGANFLEVYE